MVTKQVKVFSSRVQGYAPDNNLHICLTKFGLLNYLHAGNVCSILRTKYVAECIFFLCIAVELNW